MHGTEKYIDMPRLRYRRILLPALAWLLAAGSQAWIDAAYFGATALFVLLGAWWLSRYAVLMGRSPWWGAGFVAVPGVYVSLDRMTVDITMAALTVAFALYLRAGPDWKLYAVLVCAPLAKETGFLLVAACCLQALFQRKWSRTALLATAALPGLAWWIFVGMHTPEYPMQWVQNPFQGAFEAMFHPERYPMRPRFIVPVEYLAWLGLLLGIVMALARWSKQCALSIAAALFAVLAAIVNFSVWEEAEAFGRVFTPLLLLLPLAQPSLRTLLPMAAIIPRAATYPASEMFTVLRRIF